MLETIKKLTEEKEMLMIKVNKVKTAINALQDVCSHTDEEGNSTFIWIYNDINEELFRCSLCHKEKNNEINNGKDD